VVSKPGVHGLLQQSQVLRVHFILDSVEVGVLNVLVI
jgi:hypothetical protein